MKDIDGVDRMRDELNYFLSSLYGMGLSNLHPSIRDEMTRPLRRFLRGRPYKKCLLPGCENKTDHNGGYCCADHCKEHRRMK
jgi:hypothetical protein